MFSVFPELLWLTPLTFVLIRLSVALMFGYAAWKHVFHGAPWLRALGILELVVAAGIFVGAWTQVAAAVGALTLIVWLFVGKMRPFTRIETLLALVMCASLVVTGAGLFAFDLPL